MIALVGDAELDEGNIFEAILEGWKQGLRNCWWIIDYNRQSLDAVIREGLWSRYEALFRAFGWDVVILKYGALLEAAFAEPGGDLLRQWINQCPNQLYSALVFQGGAAWRKHLLGDLGAQTPTAQLIERRSDEELSRLMTNLAGHDLPTLIESFGCIDHDRPTCFICYTIKGFGLPFAGHKDNHAGLMTEKQMDALRTATAHPSGPRMGQVRRLGRARTAASGRARSRSWQADRAAAGGGDRRPRRAGDYPFAGDVDAGRVRRPAQRDRQAKIHSRRAPGHGLAGCDRFDQPRPLGQSPRSVRQAGARRHVQERADSVDLPLGVLADRPAHRARHRRDEPLHPVVRARPLACHQRRAAAADRTLYDPFIARGLDALNYACYQDARFILVATPSGITLAPEGGAHQSIMQPLIGIAQDGLASFEPAFVDELAVVLAWGLAYIQKAGDADQSERNWLREETGGSVYLRLSTRPIEQPKRALTPDLRREIIDGAYWLRRPGPNCQVVVAYAGAVAPEAIQAVGLMAEDRRDVGLLGRDLRRPAQCRLDGGAARPRTRARPCPLAYRANARRSAS